MGRHEREDFQHGAEGLSDLEEMPDLITIKEEEKPEMLVMEVGGN